MNYSRRSFVRNLSAALVAGGAMGAADGTPARTGAVRERALSLKVLQEKLSGRVMAGESSIIRTLAGITRLQGFVIDPEMNDLVVFGQVDPAWPALMLEDFGVALRNAFHRYNEQVGGVSYYSAPGCSIDPDSSAIERLASVSGQVANLIAQGQPETAKVRWLEACRAPQSVRLFGVPDSRFADICVVADYRMKSICDGSIDLEVDGFDSLAQRRASRVLADMRQDRRSSATGSSMNRFWFTPGEQRFKVDEGISMISESSVALATEQQLLTHRGDFADSGGFDAEATQWASDFTKHYLQIAVAEGSGIYHQLQQLFEHVAVAKLLAYEANRAMLPDVSVLLDRLNIPKANVPNELDGRGNLIPLRHVSETTRQVVTRTAALQLCGGVGIDIDVSDKTMTRGAPGLKTLHAHVVSARPTVGRLWWDLPANAAVEV